MVDLTKYFINLLDKIINQFKLINITKSFIHLNINLIYSILFLLPIELT